MNEIDEINIMLLGDGDVGKSSILYRYFNNNFIDSKLILEDEYEKTIEINGKKIIIKAYENCGESDPYIPNQIYKYYEKCEGVIFVFDICNINPIDCYFNDIYNFFKKSKKKLVFSIAANKFDSQNIADDNKIKIQKIEEKYKCKVIKTSAKENFNIDFLFQTTINKIINQNSDYPKKSDIISKCIIE